MKSPALRLVKSRQKSDSVCIEQSEHPDLPKGSRDT
jgi:hypothetical protein